MYTTQCIAEIDPLTGAVTGWLYMDGLKQHMLDTTVSLTTDPSPDVLNGIAWDEKRNKLYVTGKFWPKMYQVKERKMTGVGDAMKQSIRDACIIDPNRPL